MDKLISVIIPTYNRASMIKRAIKSVTEQDYVNLDIIVVDDASKDDTEAVVKSIQDPRIRYIRRPENRGAGTARNTGMRTAKGEYIAFLDSDDEFLPGKLKKQVEVFEELKLKPALIFTNYWEKGARRKLNISEHVKSGYVDIRKAFPASIFCNPPSCWMLRRGYIDEIGFFDEELWTMEDLDYFTRVSREYPVYFINEPLMMKHVHTCKAGSVPDKYAENTGQRILEKWYDQMCRDKRFLVKFYCMMGKDLIRSGKKKKAAHYLRKAFFLKPWNVNILWRLIKAL